ncbi:MAG: hypothetical protein AB1813_01940 [Verrucomicrobiota bacterium]
MELKHQLSTAYHEAGHAVVGYFLGIPMRSVSIIPDGDSSGRVTGYRSVITRRWQEALSFGRLSPSEFSGLEKQLVALLAGDVAQRRYAPRSARSHHSRADFSCVADVVLKLWSSDKVRAAYLKFLRARAEELVEVHWAQIDALAHALVDRRGLSGREAKSLILLSSMKRQ